MNFREIARELIEALNGIVTEENIDGVVKVFNGVKRGVDEQWEAFLKEETDETLLYNDMLCPCGRLISVTAQRDGVSVGIEEIQ